MTLDVARLEKAIATASDLPTLPHMAKALNRLIRTPQTSASQIGTLISEDQALTAQVLRVVNSAYYGFPRQINNITHSIVILGFNKVRDIVLMSSIIDSFRGKTGEFNFVEFWKHSMATAIATDALGNTLPVSCGDDAFVGGLLHDIGKLVLATSFPEPFGEALATALETNACLKELWLGAALARTRLTHPLIAPRPFSAAPSRRVDVRTRAGDNPCGVEAFGEALGKNATLETLYLGGCGEGTAALRKGVEANGDGALKVLEFDGDDAGLIKTMHRHGVDTYHKRKPKAQPKRRGSTKGKKTE